MRTTSTLAAAGIAAALLIVGTACSKSDDTATTPTTVASASSGDGNSGGSSGGSSGGGSSSGAATLPDGWPAELAMPDGVTVTGGSSLSDTAAVVVGSVDGDVEAVLASFESQLTDAGWTIVTSDFVPGDLGGSGGLSGSNDTQTVVVRIGPDGTRKLSEVTINLAGKDN